MSIRISLFVRAILVLAVAPACQNVWASEKDAEYREAVMEAIGGHMSAIVHIMKGEVPHKSHLGLHADSIAALSKIAPSLFPEGSESPDSHALPEIWEDPDAFQARMEAFQEAAPEFSAAVAGGDMSVVGPALNKLGDTCKGCHDDFKEE